MLKQQETMNIKHDLVELKEEIEKIYHTTGKNTKADCHSDKHNGAIEQGSADYYPLTKYSPLPIHVWP